VGRVQIIHRVCVESSTKLVIHWVWVGMREGKKWIIIIWI
jgi:hypothetical protein